jgi:hypothetical protein
MIHLLPARAQRRLLVAPDRPVIRLNWPRVAVFGVFAASAVMLLTYGFRAASERKAQRVSGGSFAAAQVSLALQMDPPPPQRAAAEAIEGMDHHLPLGIFVRGPRKVASTAAIEISGLPSGWALSAGRQFGENGWRIPAAKLSGLVLRPLRGFAGAIDLAVELRLADDTLVERRSVRCTRIGQAPPQLIELIRSTAVDSPPTPTSLWENIVREQVISNIREPDSEQIVLLLRVAEGLLVAGDLSAARTLLRRAAKAGNARAALLLGESYDPRLLSRFGVGSPHTDVTLARTWYEVARELGSSDARRRLDRLTRDEPWGNLPSRP